MVSTAPVPVDVVDFQFKAHCRLKIFEKDPADDFAYECSLVAVASRFGLIFVGTKTNELQVIQVAHIEDLTKEVGNYKRRSIALPSRPFHVSINCDCTKLAVIIEKDACPFVIVYDAISFVKQNIQILKEIRLTATPGCKILSIDWNPALPEIFTACKNDGSLGVYEFKGNSYEFHELPSASGATCFCWSPKGKQIAVGSRNGKITQYKPDLKAVKAIDPPYGFTTITTLCWLSSFQFVGIYLDMSEQNSLICVDAPKAGAPIYTNYEDVCYSNGNARPQQFYLMHQQHWNVVMVASSNSMEVGVLGMDGNKWIQWTLSDNSRAELPLSGKKQDTLPIGACFNVGATKYQAGDEVKQTPMLMVLSDYGVLCTFNVVNSRSNVMDICCPREVLSDRSGDGLFTTNINIATTKETITPLQPKPILNVNTVQQQSHQGFVPASTAPITKSYGVTQAKPQATQSNQFIGIGNTLSSAGFTPKQNATQPLFKPQLQTQPLINRNVGLSIQQPPVVKPQSVEQPTILKTPEPTFSPTTITNTNVPPSLSDRLPINEETDAMIAQLIREECYTLEAELKNILERGNNLTIKVGAALEGMHIDNKTSDIENFYKEIKETVNTLDTEVYTLNQNLMQTWACFEEGRTRFTTFKDPMRKILLQTLPLDPGSQHQLDEISRMVYYLESQLLQANQSLDEQWDTFQDNLMKSNKLKIPTMESVYQTMVQHSKIMQKQKYMLQHIRKRIQSAKRNNNNLINVGTDENSQYVDLEQELSKLQMHHHSIIPHKYNKLIKQQAKLDMNKTAILRDFITKHKASRVCAAKTQLNNSTLQLSTLLQAPLSPIAPKKGLPVKLDFVMSTPKSQEIKILKGPVQTFTPTTVQNPLMPTAGFSPQLPGFGFSGKPLNVSSSAPILSSSSFITPIPGTGNIGTVVKPLVATVSNTSHFGGELSKIGTQSSQTDTPISVSTSISKSLFGSVGLAKTSKPMFSVATTTTTAKPIVAGKHETETKNGNLLKGTTSTCTGFVKTSIPAGTNVSIFAKFAPATTVAATTKSTFTSAKTTTVSAALPMANTTVGTPMMKNLFGASASTDRTPKTGSFIVAPTPTNITSIAPSTIQTSTPPVLTVKPALLATPSTVGISAITTPSVSSQSIFGSISSTSVSSASSTSGGLFGSKTSTQSLFGSNSVSKSTSGTSAIFGSVSSTTSNLPLLVAATTTANAIIATTTTGTSIFTAPSKPFGTSGSLFGSSGGGGVNTVVTSTGGISIFAAAAATAINTTTTTKSLFAAPSTVAKNSSTFGAAAITTAAAAAATTKSIFSAQAPTTTNIFGGQTATSTLTPDLKPASSIFASAPITTTSISVTATIASPSSIFGGATTTTSSIFSAPIPTTTIAGTTELKPATSSIFGGGDSTTSLTQSSSSTASLFGTSTSTTSSSVFGGTALTTASPYFGSPPPAAATSAFGVPASVFASATPSSTTPAFGSSSSFGGAGATTTSQSLFGSSPFSAAPAFGSTFGSTPANVSSSPASPFGQTVTTTAVSPLFGQAAVSASPLFGGGGGSNTSGFSSGSLFGQPAKFGSASVFGGGGGGTAATSSAFGASTVFGQVPASTTNTPFGAASAFGQSSPFGAATTTTTPSGFAQNQPAQNAFGSSFSGSAFGAQSPPPFGSPSSTSGNTFGSFGSLSVGGTTGTSFGQAATPSANPFGRTTTEQKTSFGSTPGNLFGSPASTVTNAFGVPQTSQTFGNSSFGQQQQSTFGNSSFGSAGQGAFTSNTQSIQQSGFGGSPSFQKPAFGSAPVFGQPAFGGSPSFGAAPTFGGGATFGSPQKVFGGGAETSNSFGGSAGAIAQSSTFGSIANQSTVGFGNLAAQQATHSQPLSFSGGSSFTNWRN